MQFPPSQRQPRFLLFFLLLLSFDYIAYEYMYTRPPPSAPSYLFQNLPFDTLPVEIEH